MFLEEIRQSVAELKGVGPQSRKQLEAAGLGRVCDLLWCLPRSYDDRSQIIPLALTRSRLQGQEAVSDTAAVNTVATVLRHEWAGNGRRRFLKIVVADESAEAALLCFNRDFLARNLPVGARICLAGKAEYRYGELQLSRFDYAPWPSPDFERILPVYPLSGDLGQGQMRKALLAALETYGIGISECLPAYLVERYGFPPRKQAFRDIHLPPGHAALAAARRRLVYEELFFLQLQLARTRLARSGGLPPPPPPDLAALPTEPPLVTRFRAAVGFQLTPGQERAWAEIRADLHASRPMSRLLQGDVGSGKTVVALLAALETIAMGKQAAIMVPTVLLAMQHAERAAKILEPLGVSVALLAGAMKKGVRSPLTTALASGHAQLVVGTHGLFSPSVSYANLGLVIIDEQHRFGVRQRNALYHKADRPHLLSMSATPIPQTLALTLFGDMDASVIDTLPVGRKPVETHLARLSNAEKVYQWVDKEIAKGHQAYFVYPLIEEGDGESDLKSAQAMAETLAERYGNDAVALLHSKVDEAGKQALMHAFAAGQIKVLAATSVVEVGVDVANATCMVIEHAERFGMAALHQLRGRVGRSDVQSYCFLVYGEPLSDDGKARLMALKASHDGFQLAEKDLEIRGPGDLAGNEQSGYLRLRAADLVRDSAVMVQARADVQSLLAADPTLERSEHAALRYTIELDASWEEA